MDAKNLGKQQAYPVPAGGVPGDVSPQMEGLTKREAFAMEAMSSVMSGVDVDSIYPEGCAKTAVELADALLAELAKEA